ncbi:MAG: hypothetical protein RR584_16755, partial [Comamonas sp.]
GENRKFLGVISRTTMLRFLDRDTPPVPPPQPVQPPLTLNPLFSTGDADSPTMLQEHSDSAAIPTPQGEKA